SHTARGRANRARLRDWRELGAGGGAGDRARVHPRRKRRGATNGREATERCVARPKSLRPARRRRTRPGQACGRVADVGGAHAASGASAWPGAAEGATAIRGAEYLERFVASIVVQIRAAGG